MAVQPPGVWGIDLGQCALKAIRLELQEGQVVANAFDFIEHPKILSQPDADPDQLTREALEQFLSRNSLRGDMVVISVPGQSGLARFVKLPPVEEKKIADIVRFEAKQQIPFPLEEVVWDFQKLSSGSLAGDFVETEIGLFAMKREMVHRALQQFKEVNVEVHVIQMAPLALCNFIAYDQLQKGPAADGAEEDDGGGKKACVVALDMGTDSSNLVITDGGKIIWQRPIPIGGNHFTRALTKDLKLTFAKAEHLKRNAAKSPDLRKILASLKSVLNDFVGEVQRSLGYFTNTHRDAQIKYMVGLGNAFRLPGLKQFLQEKLQLEVKKLGKFERLSGDAVTAAPTFADNIMSFGVCYGLALQGLAQTRLHTNLLPHEVRVERLVRGKKPWAAAAAACLLVAIAGLAVAKGLENSKVTGDDIDKAKAAAKSVLGKVNENKNAYEKEETRIKELGESLIKLGAGTKERSNWQLLHEYVNFALPLANGDRVPERAANGALPRQKYINDKSRKALAMLEAMRFPSKDKIPDKKKAFEEDQFIKKYLIQVNIEGVNSLFTDDLGPYFRKIHNDTAQLFGLDPEEKRKVVAFVQAKEQEARDKAGLPKVGWVVEVRGYTYHEAEFKFVEETFLENLRNPEYRRNAEWLKKQPEQARKQFEEMDKVVRENVSYLIVYKNKKVLDPEPGKFDIIAQSDLRTLVRGLGEDGAAVGGPPGQVGPPGKPGAPLAGPGPMGGDIKAGPGGLDPNDANKPNREGWVPVGDVASTVLGAAGGAGFGAPGAPGVPPGMPAGPPGKVRPGPGPAGPLPVPMNPGFAAEKVAVPGGVLQPRTEFVILFVWREPLPAEAPPNAPADEKKDEKK